MGTHVTKIKSVVSGMVAIVALTAAGTAGSLAEQFSACAAKFADTKTAASVMLECTAGDGKLSACKVLEAPTPAGGFDKAAMCVAEVLPIGSKTGPVKVPVKFNPG